MRWLPSLIVHGPTCDLSPLSVLQAQRHVSDLYEDLRDGHNLISLLEVLSGETLVSYNQPFVYNLTGSASAMKIASQFEPQP